MNPTSTLTINGIEYELVDAQAREDIDTLKTQVGADLPIASDTVAGTIRVGENLQISADGVLSVTTAAAVEQDNTHPITAAAVYTEVGNINALLETI